MTHDLSGSMARLALIKVKEVSGPQYANILQGAGLARYIATLPPEGAAPAITGAEIAQFQQVIYQMLGADLFRLFQRNFSRAGAEGLLGGAWGQNLRSAVVDVPPADRLGWLVGAYHALASREWGTYTLTEDATAWVIAAQDCLECPGITGARVPLCPGVAVVVKTMAEQILGQRIRAEEIACRAAGATACQTAVYKRL